MSCDRISPGQGDGGCRTSSLSHSDAQGHLGNTNVEGLGWGWDFYVHSDAGVDSIARAQRIPLSAWLQQRGFIAFVGSDPMFGSRLNILSLAVMGRVTMECPPAGKVQGVPSSESRKRSAAAAGVSGLELSGEAARTAGGNEGPTTMGAPGRGRAPFMPPQAQHISARAVAAAGSQGTRVGAGSEPVP